MENCMSSHDCPKYLLLLIVIFSSTTHTAVMALYPQTTCFYRAIIHESPKGPQDDYQVLFEDSSYAEGYSPSLSVAQRYVIACKENRKK